MALEITEMDLGGITLLKLSGDLVLGNEGSQLRSKLKDLLGKGKTRLVLDLANVRDIDSTGLGAIVSGYTTAQNQGAGMKLANLSKKFQEQLTLTKLITVFDVYGSVEAAIKSFGPTS